VFLDLPFGITKNKWDTALTDKEILNVLIQIQATNKQESYTIIVKHHPYHGHRVLNALNSVKATGVHPFYWYKNNQNIEGFKNYVFAVETFTIGFIGPSQNRYFHMSANPLERHNIISGPTVNRYWKNDHGRRINTTQNQPGLMRMFALRHCSAEQHCLVLGSGSGTDMLGVMQARRSGVGVEKDPDQWMASCQNLMKKIEKHKSLEGYTQGDPMPESLADFEAAPHLQTLCSDEPDRYHGTAIYDGDSCCFCALQFTKDNPAVNCCVKGCVNVFHDNHSSNAAGGKYVFCGSAGCKGAVKEMILADNAAASGAEGAKDAQAAK
jgi:hypothetical protein